MKAMIAALAMLFDGSATDQARHLLFGTLETAQGENYAGAGWMFAPRDLGSIGPVMTTEIGVKDDGTTRFASWLGWRLTDGKLIATLMFGAEYDEIDGINPGVSTDIWWDDQVWMVTGRIQATSDYTSWRGAFGRRIWQDKPWFGLEVAKTGDNLRAGVHATAIELPWDLGATASAGWSENGGYGSFSVWKRF